MAEKVCVNVETAVHRWKNVCILQALVHIAEVLIYLQRLSQITNIMGSGDAVGTDVVTIVGATIMALGILLESAADFQKSQAKKAKPFRFCDKGLYKIVRCPNYLGEVLFWTGVFVSGINIYASVWQWIGAALGYVCIVYIMFGGARRLELRQNRNYGEDPEYQVYVKKTPILLPLVPLYSVAKYKWLVG